MRDKRIRFLLSPIFITALGSAVWLFLSGSPASQSVKFMDPGVIEIFKSQDLQYISRLVWRQTQYSLLAAIGTSGAFAILWLLWAIFGFKPEDPKAAKAAVRSWWIAAFTCLIFAAFIAWIPLGTPWFGPIGGVARYLMPPILIIFPTVFGISATVFFFWIAGTLFSTPPLARHAVPLCRYIP